MGSSGTGLPNDSGAGVDSPINIPGLPDFTIKVADIAPPDQATDLPREHLKNYFRDAYTELKNIGVPGWCAVIIAGLIVAPAGALMVAKDLVIVVLRVVLPVWGGEVLGALDDLRKSLDATMGELAVDVLNELLGTTIQPSDMPQGGAFGDHLARADKIGGILHDVLLQEFQQTKTVTPESGRDAARRFSGLMINFGTATGVLATLGGLVPTIHLDEVREIGEQVAQNLGLGRLGRQVLRPIVQALIAEPYGWWINEQARQAQFSVSDVVNPFSGSVMDAGLIHQTLALQGYSDDKIKAIIELHQKKIAETDIFFLYAMGLKTEDQVTAYLEKLGYSHDDALDRKEAEFLRRETTLQDELVSVAIDAYKFGNIERDELEGIVKTARPLANEQGLTLLLADYKRKVPHRSLTVAELTSMLQLDIITLDEFDSYLSLLGFSDADVQNLRILTLTQLEKKSEAQKAKDQKAAAAAAAAAAKAAGATSPTAAG